MEVKTGRVGESVVSATHGWVVGHMQSGLGQTTAVEVKLWRYDSQPDYPRKAFHGTEFIVIYGGVLRISLEKDGECQDIILRGENQDYVVLGPGITKQVFVFKAPAFGVTVRWPSDPNLNQVFK